MIVFMPAHALILWNRVEVVEGFFLLCENVFLCRAWQSSFRSHYI